MVASACWFLSFIMLLRYYCMVYVDVGMAIGGCFLLHGWLLMGSSSLIGACSLVLMLAAERWCELLGLAFDAVLLLCLARWDAGCFLPFALGSSG